MNDVKVPLALAAQNLATLMEAIDEGRLDEAVIRLFNDQRLDLASAVDRRLCFFDICEKHIESLKDIARKYQTAAKQLENVMETLEKNTLDTMRLAPDVPYRGDLGSFRIQKNGAATVNVLFETDRKTISNAVDAQDIEKYAIDEKFYDVHTYYSLVMDRIRRAIEAGEDIRWAAINKGEHLRRTRK